MRDHGQLDAIKLHMEFLHRLHEPLLSLSRWLTATDAPLWLLENFSYKRDVLSLRAEPTNRRSIQLRQASHFYDWSAIGDGDSRGHCFGFRATRKHRNRLQRQATAKR